MKIVKNIAVFGLPNAGTTTLLDELYADISFVLDAENDYKFIFDDASAFLSILKFLEKYGSENIDEYMQDCVKTYFDKIDCIIWVIDSTIDFVNEASLKVLMNLIDYKKLIIAFNKCDSKIDIPNGFENAYSDAFLASTCLFTSFQTGKNYDFLKHCIYKKLFPHVYDFSKFIL